jgi:uncharacterized RDD family membrane protein YckC
MYDAQDHGGLPHPVADARFYSGVPLRRLLAFALDTLAIFLLGLVAGLIFGLATLGAGFALIVPVMGVTGLAYRIGSLARWSATPGMWATGIEFRRRDGHPFGLGEAVIHTVVFTVCMMTGIVQVVSMALMALAPLGRGVPDLLLGSAAINRPA